jgi:hypothetical protein
MSERVLSHSFLQKAAFAHAMFISPVPMIFISDSLVRLDKSQRDGSFVRKTGARVREKGWDSSGLWANAARGVPGCKYVYLY